MLQYKVLHRQKRKITQTLRSEIKPWKLKRLFLIMVKLIHKRFLLQINIYKDCRMFLAKKSIINSISLCAGRVMIPSEFVITAISCVGLPC